MKKIYLPIVLILVTIVYLGLGYGSLNFSNLINTVIGQGSFKEDFILYSIRLPRVLILIIAGGFLAISGAVFQTLFKNSLADPGIIGINSGAGVAITVYYLFFPLDSGKFIYMIPIIGFMGSLIMAFFLLFISYEKGKGFNNNKLIMFGLGLSIALSGLMIVLVSSSERIKVEFITKWLNGNIWGADWPFIIGVVPWFLVLFIILSKYRTLDILSLKEESSIGLGLNIFREKIILFLSAVSLSAVAVSVTGSLSFVGLIAPHIAKSIWGNRAKDYLYNSLFMGAILLVIADLIGKNIIPPEGVATGTVFSIIGAPYLIYLIAKKNL